MPVSKKGFGEKGECSGDKGTKVQKVGLGCQKMFKTTAAIMGCRSR